MLFRSSALANDYQTSYSNCTALLHISVVGMLTDTAQCKVERLQLRVPAKFELFHV
jgi:hypothetical protein